MAIVQREITKNGLTGQWRFYPPDSIVECKLADYMQEVPEGLVGIVWEQLDNQFIQNISTGHTTGVTSEACICDPISDPDVSPPVPVAVVYST